MTGPLRIVVVGPLPPPQGGMANQTEQLVRLLDADGHRVRTVRTNIDYWPRWVASVRGLRAALRVPRYLVRLCRSMADADVVHVMANSGWAWHLFAAPAVWVAWLRGRRVVVKYCGGGADAFLRRSEQTIRLSMRRVSLLLVPSEFLQQVFAKYGMASEIVPDVIDVSRFRYRDSVVLRDAPHAVITRNLEAVYDLPTAIRAFAELTKRYPRARLSIAGRGIERPSLERLVADLGLKGSVRFLGSLGQDEIAALYADADLMLNSSRVDNTPNALLEAVASGVPIVSTDPGGIPFMVQHEHTALLVPCGDFAAMARQAERVLSDAQLADRLRRNGREMLKRYSWENVRPTLLASYNDAASGRARRPCAA